MNSNNNSKEGSTPTNGNKSVGANWRRPKDATTLFRAVNFELFMDPTKRSNRFLGLFGTSVFAFTVGYLWYEKNRLQNIKMEKERIERKRERRERRRKKRMEEAEKGGAE